MCASIEDLATPQAERHTVLWLESILPGAPAIAIKTHKGGDTCQDTGRNVRPINTSLYTSL